MRYDILSKSQTQTLVKLPRTKSQIPFSLHGCKAFTHPSNNSVFLINGGHIYLFDNENEVLLAKPVFPQIADITRQAICYNEGFIYFLGGFDRLSQRSVNVCSRYNVVTEKWQMLSPMNLGKMDAAACPINEY